MYSKTEYRKKLQDPRWQKKRLGILERDGFACFLCTDKKTTLHVHHKRYVNGDPWDIPDSALVTLCEVCHSEESKSLKETADDFIAILRDRFNADELATLMNSFVANCPPERWGSYYLGDDPRLWLVPKEETRKKARA